MNFTPLNRRQALAGTVAVSSAWMFSAMLPASAADTHSLLTMSAQEAVSAIQSITDCP